MNTNDLLRGTAYPPSSSRVSLQGWNVELHADGDGHLNVYIDHDDKSGVIDCDVDGMSDNDEQWATRFTTVRIEDDYDKAQ